MSSVTMDDQSYNLFFQALANKTRVEILELLKRKPMNVTEICKALKLEQSRVSHHLRCLKFCGFVSGRQNGKSRVYFVNQETTIPLLALAANHIEKHAQNLRFCKELEY